MNLHLNGQKITYAGAPDIESLLANQGYAGKIVAVARNRLFVPKTLYAATMLQDGDHIDIVAPMQGG